MTAVGIGCAGTHTARWRDHLPLRLFPRKPAAQITPAFTPQVQYLPDPSRDNVLGAGILGQMFVLASDGSFTDAAGDLYVSMEDMTPRLPGQPPMVTEVFHFDATTLKKMRTSDERFGNCYALFLPYPTHWKDVTQVRINTQLKPYADASKEPILYGPSQTVLLDFTPPGSQPSVWLDKSVGKPTAPIEMKGMPNVARDLAKGGLGAPITTPQAVPGAALATGPKPTPVLAPATMPAAATAPVVPGGPVAPVLPPAPPPIAPPTPPIGLPDLPPPMTFSPDRPQAVSRGPNGQTITTTAFTLPPGESVPPGWGKKPDGSIQPVQATTPAGSANQWQYPPQGQQVQSTGYVPASQKFVPASQRFVPASERSQTQPQTQLQTQPQGRIQHGAMAPPPATTATFPTTTPAVVPPTLPTTAVPTGIPPVAPVVGGPIPSLPTTPSGVGGPYTPALPPTNFDPTSPVGGWATPPSPPPPPSGYPTVVPPSAAGVPDAPRMPAGLPR
jgi:hypothetical protein